MRRLIAWVVVAGTLTLPVACSDDGPDSADSFTEVVTLHGQDGAVWELGVQGFVVGSSAVNNRVNGPCVSVLASLHLVDGPGLGAAFGPSVAAAGLTVVDRDSQVVDGCALDDDMERAVGNRWGQTLMVLPGTTVGAEFDFQLRRDDVPDELAIALGDLPAVTIHPRRLDTAPPPIGGVAGAVPGPLQPAGTETALTLASGDMISEIRVTGVQVVPFDDHWCVIAYVSGVASFEPYLMNPGSIGVVADGVWNTSQAAGLCLPDDSPPEWQSILTPPGPPAGSRVPLTAAVVFPERPDVQAIMLPSGGPDWVWVLVEPVLVDSPPPWPS
ncbi:MAG: hypothetical protein KDB06_08405 [Ilumatobacter sp.]|nr:hypothetical protein [Ilumatobacter sp.]MCB0984659.1 hypothetical protein [Ilumatobacter sp.]MCO5331451.1 hypothetical protein [Ilumatobacteraceae bacterium]